MANHDFSLPRMGQAPSAEVFGLQRRKWQQGED